MPRTFTVAEMVTTVRQRADLENDEHVTDPEIIANLSAAYAELVNILISTGIPYFEKEKIYYSVGSPTRKYGLPSDYLGTLRVDYISSTEEDIEIIEISPRALSRVAKTTSGRALYYRVVGSDLYLYPIPPSGQQYRFTYVPNPVKLTTTTQEIDGFAGFEEFVIVGACIRCLAKQDRNTNFMEGERTRLTKLIEATALNRSLASSLSLVESASSYGGRVRGPEDDWPER